MLNSNYSIDEFINKKNFEKLIFTAGPASLTKENISGLRPCFGRGDKDYEKLEKRVLKKLKELSGHKEIIRMNGLQEEEREKAEKELEKKEVLR